MKLKELVQDRMIDLYEVFSTTSDIDWKKPNQFSDRGTFVLNGVEYIIRIDCISYQEYNFLELGFTADLGDGHSFNRTNIVKDAFRVLGIVQHAAIEKLDEYDQSYKLDGVIFGVIFSNDKDVESALDRYRSYERMATMVAKRFKFSIKGDIKLPGDKGIYILLVKGKIPQDIQDKIQDISIKKNT